MTGPRFKGFPKFSLFSREDVEKIHLASLQILEQVGVMVKNEDALNIFARGGAEVDFKKFVVKVPRRMVEESLAKAPSIFKLYFRDGEGYILIGGSDVSFAPGSTALYIIDPRSGDVRKPVSKDLTDFAKLTDALSNIKIQSTALVVSEVPEPISDCYRLYIALKNSAKPIITGAFTVEGVHRMVRMLEAVAGGLKGLADKPRAIFDVCPSPPLMWSRLTSQNLIDCAKLSIPIEIVPMPQSGATGPATLAGALAQLNAEFLSGLTLAQLVKPGAPVIYGGSPSIFDMRHCTAPLGAIESIMLTCGYVQLAKYYGLPSHGYLGLSDAKIIDAQAGFESGVGILIGALAGLNIIAGLGMLDFENCQSFEKLVIDNEFCGMALRFLKGVEVYDETLAINIVKEAGPGRHYLDLEHTLKWFRREHFIPSMVIDRSTRKAWMEKGAKDVAKRAREAAYKIIEEHRPKPLPKDVERDLDKVAEEVMKAHGKEGSLSLP